MARRQTGNEKKLETTVSLVTDMFQKYIGVLESRSAYGNPWMNRRVIYFTDRIASKVARIQNIENSLLLGEELKNADIEEELKDIISYAFFALIKISWLKKDVNWIFRYFGAMGDNNE